MGNEDSRLEEGDITLSPNSITQEPVPTAIKIEPNRNSNDLNYSECDPVSLLPPSRHDHPILQSINLSFATQSSERCSTPITPALPITPYSSHSTPIQLKTEKSTHAKRKSSILIAYNGITDQYISSRICKIAAIFWQRNIETLSLSEQLEVGCAMFFCMLSSNDEMKQIMKSNFNESPKIEKKSLRYLDMMGWLIRCLATDNMNLPSLLIQLGALHRRAGIKIEHFYPMLQAMHETFSYYFGSKYSIEVKYSMDEIFSMASQIMTGTELTGSTPLMDIITQFQANKIPFLKDLRSCLDSNVGKEYLFRFLSQTCCDEITIFLQSLHQFKSRMTDKERFMVAQDIVSTCIQSTAIFALNVSHDARSNTLNRMMELKQKFARKESFEITAEFFSEVENEIYKLIVGNHWSKFVRCIQALHSKSLIQSELQIK